jgi:hypothetical protein
VLLRFKPQQTYTDIHKENIMLKMPGGSNDECPPAIFKICHFVDVVAC